MSSYYSKITSSNLDDLVPIDPLDPIGNERDLKGALNDLINLLDDSFNAVEQVDQQLIEASGDVGNSLTDLSNSISELSNEQAILQSRIDNLFLDTTTETGEDGSRLYLQDFYLLLTEDDIDGLKQKLVVYQNSIANKVDSITANSGSGIVIDSTNPSNPTITTNNRVKGITANSGSGITVDNTDPYNPVISANDRVKTIIAGPGITVDSTNAQNPTISASVTDIPTGVVLAYNGDTAPTGFLLCDGSAVSRTTYSDLFSVVGTTHGSGNGSTTFNVPDYRGAFLRGAGSHGSQTMANGSAFDGGALGSYSNDIFQGHRHDQYYNSLTASTTGSSLHIANTTSNTLVSTANDSIRDPKTDSTNGTPRVGSETKPFSSSVNYIIKV